MNEQSPNFIYFEALSSLKNPRGQRICTSETIQKLWNLNTDIDDLLKLFSYEDDQTNETFFSESLALFLEDGTYTTKDFLEIADLVDHQGNKILRSSNEFLIFSESKAILLMQ
jgi:hypothetical protein